MNALPVTLVLVAAVLVAACDVGLPAGRTPHREGNRLDMNDQPKLKPQRKDVFLARPTGLMEPQPGTEISPKHRIRTRRTRRTGRARNS